MTDSTRWKATLYVGGLSNLVTAATIHDAFIPFGEIADVKLPKNDNPKSAETHRGFAYVEFEDADDAKEAMDNMDQAELFGRIIKVHAAKPPKSTQEGGLGSRTAVWEQEGWIAQNAVGDEDRLQDPSNGVEPEALVDDPMQGLEGLDVAGPRAE
ncbi:nuclear cap-binding protein [Gaeumannomyces tritici R3-111a-1]|uniref:Nuclear cap-binding protein n=1 Tax=Gaeumannomyces tritici (strain R3-111a-1) TaxID=644352 RepID=J3NSM3_GAET3|nr:nuclear cap-binding protein [Gaeumannomyces tritici R3-111a-1]EJT79186.1 nuclear cap-binding protein [Gaeumannomyces tritici R3-111a-1]